MPTIEIAGTLLEISILAGSEGKGSAAPGSDKPSVIIPGQSGGSGPKYPGVNDSKEHNFNAWETWDEY